MASGPIVGDMRPQGSIACHDETSVLGLGKTEQVPEDVTGVTLLPEPIGYSILICLAAFSLCEVSTNSTPEL